MMLGAADRTRGSSSSLIVPPETVHLNGHFRDHLRSLCTQEHLADLPPGLLDAQAWTLVAISSPAGERPDSLQHNSRRAGTRAGAVGLKQGSRADLQTLLK